MSAVCQRSAVLLWPQLWSPTPPIWESCSWVETSCRIQEWSCFVIFCRVHTVDWRFWGQLFFKCMIIWNIQIQHWMNNNSLFQPSSALNWLFNTKWLQAAILASKVIYFICYSDCGTAVCPRWAVFFWPQLWSPTPFIWESWSWEETTSRIQEWSCCVIFCRVNSVDWKL